MYWKFCDCVCCVGERKRVRVRELIALIVRNKQMQRANTDWNFKKLETYLSFATKFGFSDANAEFVYFSISLKTCLRDFERFSVLLFSWNIKTTKNWNPSKISFQVFTNTIDMKVQSQVSWKKQCQAIYQWWLVLSKDWMPRGEFCKNFWLVGF